LDLFFQLEKRWRLAVFDTLRVLLTLPTASYDTFMSLWNGLHPGLQEKAARSIRYTLRAEIRTQIAADESIPAMEPVPSLELDPDLVAAFLEEPEPEEADLGPLVTLPRSNIGVGHGIDDESAVGRAPKGGNNYDDYSATAEEEDGAAEEGAGDEDDDAEEDPDVENIESFSEGSDGVT
jgi:hypothetical protein